MYGLGAFFLMVTKFIIFFIKVKEFNKKYSIVQILVGNPG